MYHAGGDVDNVGTSGMCSIKGVWEISASPQFFCEHLTLGKKKVLIKKNYTICLAQVFSKIMEF